MRTSIRLAAVALTLALGARAAFMLSERPPAPGTGRVEIEATTPPAAPLRVLPPADSLVAWSARPLFVRGRRPPEPSGDGGGSPVADVAAGPRPVLLGTIVLDTQKIAMLRDASGHSRTVREGGNIDGWEVVRISPRRVELRGQLGTALLELATPRGRKG